MVERVGRERGEREKEEEEEDGGLGVGWGGSERGVLGTCAPRGELPTELGTLYLVDFGPLRKSYALLTKKKNIL